MDIVRLNTLASGVSDTHDPGLEEPVLTLSSEQGIVDQSTYFGKRVAGENTERYTRIRENDFVYNDRITARSRYGTIRRLGGLKSGIVSPIYKCFRLHDEDAAAFYDFYFQTGKHDEEIRALVNEGARAGRYNLTINQFLSTRVPKVGADERRHVADCLESLDELIAAETEKLEALKRHKTGLLEQLFPAEGETCPALRFPKYCDQLGWHTARVDELAAVTGGKRIPKGEGFSARPTDFRYIRVSDLYMGGVDPANVPYITAEIEHSIRAYKVAAGDLFISVAGTIGLVGIVPPELHNANLTENANRIRPHKIDPSFLLHAFMQPSTQSALRRSVTSNAQPKLALDRIRSLELMVPGAEEQVYIAATLNEADALVRSCYELLRDLRLHKSALMQQLFPNVDEDKA